MERWTTEGKKRSDERRSESRDGGSVDGRALMRCWRSDDKWMERVYLGRA